MLPLDAMPDTDAVQAGWLPLALVVLLGLVILGLYLNFRRHLRRADARRASADEDAGAGEG